MFWVVHRVLRGVTAGLAVISLVACSSGGGHSQGSGAPAVVTSPSAQGTPSGIVPGTQPTVAPSPVGSTDTDPAAYVCPTSDTTASAQRGAPLAGEAVRRAPARHRPAGLASGSRALVAVTYDARAIAAGRTALATRESALGATSVRQYVFRHTGRVMHVLAVPGAAVGRVESALRATPGVRAVGRSGGRRYASSVNAPYFPNDPYFSGFSTTVAPTTGAALPAPTFKTEPLVENADVPGQWDMHVMRLEYAFGYSQAANGSNVTNRNALGSAAVKIAIIDTGEDTTHPELNAKISYQRCFITSPGNVASTSSFTTDPSGHGTDVAGIAGAAIGNGLGFAGSGGNVQLYGYRVFPTPSDSCADPGSSDAQCGAAEQDVASAIVDAVDNNVNVISLSLGGDACLDGADPDGAEGAAIADAIAANVIIVAAAGNGTGPPVEAPACDPGVIAVGATALADGTTNGSAKAGGSPTAPFEYVASYSDYGTPGAAPGSASAWGIVAPGGDPSSGNDADNLHWIENIWTSAPFTANASDMSFAGNCNGDYPARTGTADCRILIAGTSMSTPHVAGAAALILSVNSNYQSPTLMKQLLCATADDIKDPNEGCGRLDVYRAMASALSDASPPGPSPVP